MRIRPIIIVTLLVLLIAGGIGLFVLMRPLVMAPPVKPVEPATLPALPSSTPSPKPTPSSTPSTPTPKPTTSPTPTPEAAPTNGTLVFESDVPDTGVFVDRV